MVLRDVGKIILLAQMTNKIDKLLPLDHFIYYAVQSFEFLNNEKRSNESLSVPIQVYLCRKKNAELEDKQFILKLHPQQRFILQ